MKEYERKQAELLKLVKSKGILIKRMDVLDSLLSTKFLEYKKSLGCTTSKNIFGNITHVYAVFEDFGGYIKYYDFPKRIGLFKRICLLAILRKRKKLH